MGHIGRLTVRQVTGGVLYSIGVGLSALLAFVGGATKPASQAADAVLVILVALATGGASWAFSGRGRADASHAQQSTLRLFLTARKAKEAGDLAQQLFEGTPSRGELHSAMGILSTDFSWIQEFLISAIEDWRVFHPDAVEAAEKARKVEP